MGILDSNILHVGPKASYKADVGSQGSYVLNVDLLSPNMLNIDQGLLKMVDMKLSVPPYPNVPPSNIHGCNMASLGSSFCKHH